MAYWISPFLGADRRSCVVKVLKAVVMLVTVRLAVITFFKTYEYMSHEKLSKLDFSKCQIQTDNACVS
jgi:hypothetical protein